MNAVGVGRNRGSCPSPASFEISLLPPGYGKFSSYARTRWQPLEQSHNNNKERLLA